MCNFRSLAIIVMLLVLALPMAALAQTVVDTLPPQYEFGEVSEWLSDGDKQADARWRGQVLERYAPELAAGQYLKVLVALADESRADLGRNGGTAGAVFQARFDTLVREFRLALRGAAIADSVKTDRQRSAVLQAMGMRGADSLRPDLDDRDGMTFQTVYFMNTPDEFPLYEEIANEKFRLLVPPEVMYSMRLRGDAVHAVFMDFVDPVQQQQHAAIVTANNKWDNYLADGYSQYPWEALLNGWVMNFHAFNPPDKQIILLHPSLAVEASTLSLDEMTAKEVLNVELLGFLWYFGKNNEHYTGLSLSTVLRDDLRPGFGPVLHWRRNVSLGVAWHDLDGNKKFDEDPYVFMSIDAFRFLQSEGPKFRTEYEKAKAYLD